MKTPPRTTVFVEKRIYRMRRKLDALRLIPIIAAMLFMIPLLLQEQFEAPSNVTAQIMIYLFAAWAFVIIAIAILLRQLRPVLSDGEFDVPVVTAPESRRKAGADDLEDHSS